MSPVTYKQEIKSMVRHTVIRSAVDLLTTNRAQACCVRNSYVRDLYDYFISLKESHEQVEAKKIDTSFIREWERMHRNLIGVKHPDELTVCYLSGPEPENDFDELVSVGVLPQNIWAFESENTIYLQALRSVDGSTYMQPKIIKTSIERFFESTPKKFDIVYIDACASLISDKHALRCVASLFKYQRLNSPGVLITNFASLDTADKVERRQYVDLISRYFAIKSDRNATFINESGHIILRTNEKDYCAKVERDIEKAYGDFITSMVCNAGSIAIPALRFCNSNYLKALSADPPVSGKQYCFEDINKTKDNTLYKYLASNTFLRQNNADYPGICKIDKLSNELSGAAYDCGFVFKHGLLPSLQKLNEIRMNPDASILELRSVVDFFEDCSKLYQFLDRPNKVLFFDSVINQLSYPMHYVSDKAKRITYVAKEKRMFTDLLLFDECRYIYDWIPAIHQITNSFSNPSWQYTFRFGLDGLIKQRINYNNEFFFQGSVVPKTVTGFEAKCLPEREALN